MQQRLEVEFRLWNMTAMDRFEPVLVGNNPELGRWDPYKGTKARFMKLPNYWYAVTYLPAKTVYEWKWILVDKKTGDIKWEDCPNRQLDLGLVGGRADCDWNSPGQFFPDECVLFAGTHYITGEKSDALAMLGSTPALGEWNPKCGVVAVEYPLYSGWWVARALVEKGVRQEWKWAVIDEHRNVKVWEDRTNRQFESDDDMVELRTLWNADAIVEDFEPGVEHLYNTYNRGQELKCVDSPMTRWGY